MTMPDAGLRPRTLRFAAPVHLGPATATTAVVWTLAGATVVPTTVWLAVCAILFGLAALAPSTAPRGQGPLGRLWLGATTAFVAAAVLSVAAAMAVGASGAGLLATFLLLPLTACIVAEAVRHDVAGALWAGATAGALGAGAWAVVEILSGTARATGSTTNPLMFGGLAIAAGFVSVALAPTPLHHTRARLSHLALVAGVLASVLSASRGTWLALPALVAVVWRRQRPAAGAGHLVALVGCVVVASVGGQLLGGRALDRLDAAVDETSAYVGADADPETRTSSVGGRLDLWRASFVTFSEHPALGVGWGGLRHTFARQAELGRLHPSIAAHHHAHNQYLGAMANGGLLGLGTLLALLAAPAAWFHRASGLADERRRSLGAAGLVVVVSYATHALTEAVLERVLTTAFFAIAVTLLTGQLEIEARTGPHGWRARTAVAAGTSPPPSR